MTPESAANIGSHGVGAYGHANLPGPAAVIMAYTAHADRTATEPPTFAIVGQNDSIAPPAIMQQRVTALRQSGVPVEFHAYPGLRHGFGLGKGTIAEDWAADAIRFWTAHTPDHGAAR